VRSANGWFHAGFGEQELDFGEGKGQQHVKWTAEVAASGGHNILTFGPIPTEQLRASFLGTKVDFRGAGQKYTRYSRFFPGHRFSSWACCRLMSSRYEQRSGGARLRQAGNPRPTELTASTKRSVSTDIPEPLFFDRYRVAFAAG
jgi:hypothetical protein